MSLADSSGPEWFRRRRSPRTGLFESAVSMVSSLFNRVSAKRPPRVIDDDQGPAGAGDRSPLRPKPRPLAGAAAKRLEDERQYVFTSHAPRA
jgi:hypothetical protein